MIVQQTPKKPDELGLWIRASDLGIAFALLAAAFLMVRLDAVKELLALATNKDYFAKSPLLLDALRHGYSFETVNAHLNALGGEGRAYYAHMFLPLYDLALSVFLLTFSILFILYATQKDKDYAISLPGWSRRVLVIPPVLQFFFDVAENYHLRDLMDDFPRIAPKVVETASQLTQFKWMAIYVNTMILIALAAFTLYRWFQPVASHDTAP